MKSAFVRRGELMRWLGEYGFSYRLVRSWIEKGVIVKVRVPGRETGRALYSRAQVERDVIGEMVKG